jgi:hypothetical protein
VQTATGSGGTPTTFVPAFFRTSLDWAGPIQSMNVWGESLSDAAAVQELYTVIPRWRSNLLVDWRGFHDLHDASGNGNLSLIAGSLSEADGGPISMGAPVVMPESPASVGFAGEEDQGLLWLPSGPFSGDRLVIL